MNIQNLECSIRDHGIKDFFAYAKERYQIHLNRMAGMPRPWTTDPILHKYRFTQVFRELDKTTVWFRINVRDVLYNKPEVLLATVLFRLLNRIETGTAIFNKYAFDELVHARTPTQIKKAIKNIEHVIIKHNGTGPYVTGAYIITSPQGMTKLPGVLSIVEKFCLESDWWEWGESLIAGNKTGNVRLENMWNDLKEYEFFGPFHSYEMVTDLRWTAIMDNAPDINIWANPGPGARRGFNRVMGLDKSDHSLPRDALIKGMQMLLEYAHNNSKLWPHNWPQWELREVEHTLCEFDKYSRVKNHEGTPRGRYR